jgi:hypothetical protein
MKPSHRRKNKKMNKTLQQKTIAGSVIRLTDNSFDRKFNKLLSKKWIVFQDYTNRPAIFKTFFSLTEAKKFFNEYKELK